MKYGLLDDPIFSVTLVDGAQSQYSLTEILHGLATGSIVSFDALQAHQQQAWHCFLVQLAAMAVARHNDNKFPESPHEWKKCILSLSDNIEEAWYLVVEDLSKPAFMQVPVSAPTLKVAGYKSDIETPEDLDTLLLSRNHDVKANKIHYAQAEHWIYSLINNQTMNGNMGRGNYGIVRMNGGFGSRSFIGYTKKLQLFDRFHHDIAMLLRYRNRLMVNYKKDGYAYLWINNWDGSKESGLPIYECDPYFIEICRRIRFTEQKNILLCNRANSEATRIKAPDNLCGNTGDPWTPITAKEQKSLTISSTGFPYQLIQKVMLGEEYQKPVSIEYIDGDDESVYLVCQGLARGQGKTEGLFQRTILVPGSVKSRLFSDPSEKEKLAKRAAERVEMTDKTTSKVLWTAIGKLLSNGSEQRVDSNKIKPWIKKFDKEIDQLFFNELWDSVHQDQEEARNKWAEILFQEAEKVYKQAEQSTPLASFRKYRALSSARSMFYAQCRKELQMPAKSETGIYSHQTNV